MKDVSIELNPLLKYCECYYDTIKLMQIHLITNCRRTEFEQCRFEQDFEQEVESRDTRLKAKAKDTKNFEAKAKDRPSRGQSQ